MWHIGRRPPGSSAGSETPRAAPHCGGDGVATRGHRRGEDARQRARAAWLGQPEPLRRGVSSQRIAGAAAPQRLCVAPCTHARQGQQSGGESVLSAPTCCPRPAAWFAYLGVPSVDCGGWPIPVVLSVLECPPVSLLTGWRGSRRRRTTAAQPLSLTQPTWLVGGDEGPCLAGGSGGGSRLTGGSRRSHLDDERGCAPVVSMSPRRMPLPPDQEALASCA